MPVEYRLTLAGDPPVEAVAARAALDAADLSQFAPWRQVLSAGLYDTRGYSVSVRAGHDGYFGPADDTGLWEWKPQTYVNITFRMDPDPDLGEMGTHNMVESVARILGSGEEDAALILNGDVLLLTRFGGVVRKHRRAMWWDHYGYPNEIITG